MWKSRVRYNAQQVIIVRVVFIVIVHDGLLAEHVPLELQGRVHDQRWGRLVAVLLAIPSCGRTELGATSDALLVRVALLLRLRRFYTTVATDGRYDRN